MENYLNNWFQFGAIPTNAMSGTFDPLLVLLSYFIAVLASYVFLDIADLLRSGPNKMRPQQRLSWLLLGGFSMGAGIWSMHFVGMLAFKMPMEMSYDYFYTGLSMLIAIISAFSALLLLKNLPNFKILTVDAILLGFAIASMHYVGMSGMNDVIIRYQAGLFFLSILVAIFASGAALWVSSRKKPKRFYLRIVLNFFSACIMGAAIAGMHYIGMAAAILLPLSTHTHSLASGINQNYLAIFVSIFTFSIIGISLLASTYKQLISSKLHLKNIELNKARNDLENLNLNLEEKIKQRTLDLQHNLSLLQSILETSPDGILAVDLNLNVLNFNKNFLKIWSVPVLSQEHIDIKQIIQIVAEQLTDPEAFFAGIDYLKKNPKLGGYEELMLKDRRIIARYTLPQYLHEQIIGRLLIFRDITLEKRLQERLSFQYEMLKIIYEGKSIERKFLIILDKVCTFFGWIKGNFWQVSKKENQLALKNTWPLTQKADEPQRLALPPKRDWLKKVWESGQAVWIQQLPTESLEKAKLAQYSYNAVLAYPIYIDNEIYGILEFFSDKKYKKDKELLNVFKILNSQIEIFIHRRRIEDALLLNTRAVESSQDGVLIVDFLDPNQPILYVNPAFERITGYSATESIGINCRFLQKNDRDQPELHHLRLAQQEEREGTATLRNYRKNGDLFWNEVHISPIKEGNKVTHYIGTISDVTQDKLNNDQILHQATHDILTNLPNRALFFDRINQAIATAIRYQSTFSICYVDLDNFKFINDSLGHKFGDQLLIQVAKRLSQTVRMNDTVARLGGDEFAIILYNTEGGNILFENFIKAFHLPFLINERTLKISISMGISVYPQHGKKVEDLIQNADLAMYQAKLAGRNTYRIYNDSLRTQLDKQYKIEHYLRFALENNELTLNYQPIINLETLEIYSVEALLRWKNPVLGYISPIEFIPIAEQNGLIIPLGEWVLHSACRQIKDWLAAGMQPIKMAVNLSFFQFKHPSFVEKVKDILKNVPLDPDILELELTESIIMENINTIVTKLNYLKEMGIHLSIDDFGTGYSSLSYLKRLPIEKIKIDKSFIDGLPSNVEDTSITLAIIALARTLNLKILAEGVENKEQLNFLKQQQCDYIQGYMYSKPLEPQDCFEFIAHHNEEKEKWLM